MKRYVVGLASLMLITFFTGCNTESESPPAYVGNFTLESMTITCDETSIYEALIIDPPISSSNLSIRPDMTFTWTIAVIDDGTGALENCVGISSLSINIQGSVAEASGVLVFDAGTETATYQWSKAGTTLVLNDTEGEEVYEFTEN